MRRLDGGDEAGIGVGDAIGNARGVKGVAGGAVFVEEDEAAGAFAASGEELHGGLGGTSGIGAGRAEEVASSFGKNDFHDGFTVAGGRNRTGFGIGVTAGADERGIANAAGKLAACAAGGSGGEETALVIESDGADGALRVPAMMFRGVGIFAAMLPSFKVG